ncbi:MAG: rhomboid family intramembrane serine protease [Planctomycetes bacterium]|nr:rhomboid family intramembrane serine protease [Planctomycetota bacterium]
MRQVGTIPDEQNARLFRDYLLTLDIKGMVEAEDGAWTVWVYDEDDIEKSREELARFEANPADAVYRESADAAADLRKQTEKRGVRLRKQVVDVRERWNRPLMQKIPLTTGLIIVSVLVTLSCDFGNKVKPIVSALGFAKFIEKDGKEGWYLPIGSSGDEEIRAGQVWRLVTPIFIHLRWMHLLFNVYMTYVFGSMVEIRRGTLRFGLMVLLFAVAANYGQFLGSGPAGGGMSGVIYGLFGYAWMKSRFAPETGFYLPSSTVFILIAWFFICMTGAVGNIANWAHGVGLVVGVILGYGPIWWRDMQRRQANRGQ